MSQLLGPNGRPIRSPLSNKKAEPPKLGTSFGAWAGRDVEYMTMPGGGVVQFDLSKLTIADFRAMRDHYQINASLSVLSFMQHQSDWHIECGDKKIADFCEEQLKNNWTGLNRMLGTANWAGYSPAALEWENDNKSVILGKIKDLIPEECSVNWKQEEGWAPPGRTPPKFNVYDGIKQYSSPGWPIPVENCVTPDTKILCADLVWRRAGDLGIGQEIVAFDEDNRLKGRRYKTATIQVNNPAQKNCVTVTTDIGEPITMSVDHPCLVRRGAQTGTGTVKEHRKDHWAWVNAGDLQFGDRIGYFGPTWEVAEDDWEAGYIAGIMDGEGSLSNNGTAWQLGFSQNSGWVLDRALDILDVHKFEYSVNENTRDVCKQVTIKGGIREIMRFMGIFRPERVGRNVNLYENVVARIGRSVDVAVVQTVTDVGMTDIASIQTSSGTFITQGYLTHNSLWYPLLMEQGDYYGRKLLRPAFTSWFFSILLHLFANRYYERFGEPVPVGRAPFDEEIDIEGKSVRGNTYLLGVLQDLRNRSVVVLPNDKTSNDSGTGSSFDYDIEYLESQMRGADFERYMTRLDEEISIGLFTPILLLRTADVGSYNLGQGHLQVYQWMLNAMNDDRKVYADKYLLSKMTDYNFGPNAPRPKIMFRKLGNSDSSMIKDLLVALVNGDKAKPDLTELGEIAGLTLTEIKQTVAPVADPAAPPADDPAPAAAAPAPAKKTSNVTEARATGEEISKRVRGQVEGAFRNGTFNADLKISMGYKRKMERAFSAHGIESPVQSTNSIYDFMDQWLTDVVEFGVDEFSGADSFMSLFDCVLAGQITEASCGSLN